MSRWATFDCYGTLIDWNAGIGGVLERLYGAEQAPDLLRRYHELEPEIQAERYRSYAEVLTLTLERLANELGYGIPEGESGVLPQSLPDWPAFSEVPEALAELRRRGWNLAILSNSDRELIAASQRQLGVPFDLVVVAEDVGSYKPEHGHWRRFDELTADREHHVHVAASLFHDIAPAGELGLKTVWINRLGEEAKHDPDVELPDLAGASGRARRARPAMNVRRPEQDDLEAVLELMRVTDIAISGDSDWTASELRSMWGDLDLTRDAWLFELDGRVAGYADFSAKGKPAERGRLRPSRASRAGDRLGDPARDRGAGTRGGAERPGRGEASTSRMRPSIRTNKPRGSTASAATSPCEPSVG